MKYWPFGNKMDSYINRSSSVGKSSGGIMNFLSGAGGVTDKSTGSFYTPRVFNSSDELQVIYAQSWAARKFIDIPVDDQFILGRTFESDDEELVEKIDKFNAKHQLDKKIKEAQKAGRLYGTALLWFVTDESDPAKPLDTSRLKEGALKNIIVIDRYRISTVTIQGDPLQSNYMEPNTYNISLPMGKSIRVHRSRVVRFDGKMPLTISGFQNYGEQWFGLPEFTDTLTTIESEDLLARGISHLSQEASIPVVKLEGLNDAVCKADTEDMNLSERLRSQSMMKSLFRTTFLDKEDDFSRVGVTFTGLPDLMDRFATRLSAAADIPITRFMGQSPSGMNATGDGDFKNYAVSIGSRQENVLRPAYSKIDPIIAALIGVDELPPFNFPTLIDVDDKAQSETLVNLSTGLTSLIMGGMIDEEEAREVLRKNPMFAALEERDAETELKKLANENG